MLGLGVSVAGSKRFGVGSEFWVWDVFFVFWFGF